MPDLTGLTALDVAIGLAFLFFLLSTVCASINEAIAGYLGWRAQELEKALRKLLEPPRPPAGQEPPEPAAGAAPADRVSDFLADHRIHPLVDEERNERLTRTLIVVGRKIKRRRSPSYLPAGTFARVALDTFLREAPLPAKAPGKDDPAPGADVIATARGIAQQLPSGIVRNAVIDALDTGRTSIDEIRKEVEQSFDHVMDRCAGWYKRRTQQALLVIATLVTLGMNVDAFHVADRLSKDDAMRTAVVAKALEFEGRPSGDADERTPLETAAADVDRVEELGLPIGWSGSNGIGEPLDVVRRIPGWLLTILAIMLGAPFWFDVLGKFAKLRNTGNREGTLKNTAREPEDRDDPSAVR